MASYFAATPTILSELHTWLEVNLGCPLIQRSLELELPLTDDALEKKLQPFIVPGKKRIHLFEWLLHTYDSSLLEAGGDALIEEEDAVRQIVIALK